MSIDRIKSKDPLMSFEYVTLIGADTAFAIQPGMVTNHNQTKTPNVVHIWYISYDSQ